MVEVMNAGVGPVVAGGKLLWPGESCRLTQSEVAAVNAVHGVGTLVAVGQALAAAEEGAPVESAPVVEAAASGRKGRK